MRNWSASSTPEARLIDEKRLEEWYELFAEDGAYWMPLTRGQKSPTTENSLMYEDKLLLQVRIRRLAIRERPFAGAAELVSACAEAPSIEDRGSVTGVAVLRTAFMYVESRQDDQQVYAGVAWHHLKRVNDRLVIP